MAVSRSRFLPAAALSLLSVLMVATYAQVAHFGLVYEDPAAYGTLSGSLVDTMRILFSPQVIGSRYWLWFSYQITGVMGGGIPALHLTNVALHLLNGCLLWIWLGRIGASELRLGAVAVFWLHPLQSESIAYLVMRSELLCALALLVILLGLTLSSRIWACVCVLLGAWLAAGSKELGVIVPMLAAVFWCAWYRPTGRAWARVGIGAAAAAAVALAAWWLHGAYFQTVVATYMTPDYRHFGYASMQACVVAKTAWRIVWPFGQQVSTTCELVWPPLTTLALVSLAMTAIGSVVAIARAQTRWWHLALLLTLVWWGPRWVIPSREFITEHHWYVPMVFISIALADACRRVIPARIGALSHDRSTLAR